MKTSMTFISILAFFAFQSINTQDKGELTLTFENINPQKGDLMVGIFEEDNFLKTPDIGKTVKVDQNTITVVFEDLPEGEYAISVLHDLNGNKDMDFDGNGMPIEPWVMSGNPNPNAVPSWNATKFKYKGDDQSMTLSF